MADKFVIIVDRASATKLNAVHEAIKANARGWWHHFESTWIVSGDNNAGQWRDIVTQALVPRGQSNVLVLKISDVPGGRWAGGGAKGSDWLKKTFPPPSQFRK